ncbi:hypothetical protein EDB81DRAFT_895874 [Dactylonectria macrodidyma]|uniref:Chitin-binding type-1 domain-containing protein n=1 Tax=Dactylonectria macrodidyma TaxID=307937 RepID=A0A9P9JM74_9HYPO|nr:hypothetical protein EDB81DRAFT_895874 [Dactylonectria macrodidyma]
MREFTFTLNSIIEVPFEDPYARFNETMSIPLTNGTRKDCWEYDWWNSSLGTPPTASSAAQWYGISMEQLMLWNPSVSDEDEVLEPLVSYCNILSRSTSVVSEPPTPRASGETGNCTEWFKAVLDCETYLTLLDLNLATFFKWNPSVGDDCSAYQNGTYYCYETGDDDGEDGGSAPTGTISQASTASPTSSSKASSTMQPSTKTSSGPSPTSTTNVSCDGTCGGTDGMNCKGSAFGDCCSSSGYCGSSSQYCGGGCQTSENCGKGCQSEFGLCD